MIGNIADIAVDEKRATGGLPLDLGRGRVLYVRKAGAPNYAYRDALARLYSEHRDEIEAAPEGSEQRRAISRRLERQLDAESLVDRWEGFEDEDGQPLDATAELVLELFEASPDTHERVRLMAIDEEAYRLDADIKSGD